MYIRYIHHISCNKNQTSTKSSNKGLLEIALVFRSKTYEIIIETMEQESFISLME